MRRRTIALERNGAPLCTRSGCLRTLRGELTLKVGEKLRVLLSLTGRDGCVENAGNQAAAFRRVVHDLPSSMLEHLGHGAIGSPLADGNDRSLLALRRWDARRLRTDPFARLLTVQALYKISGQKGTPGWIVSTALASQTGKIRLGRDCGRLDIWASSSVVLAD